MTRSQSKAELWREAGCAGPPSATCSTPRRFETQWAAAAPEVVVHQLTDLPPNLDPRKMEEQTAG